MEFGRFISLITSLSNRCSSFLPFWPKMCQFRLVAIQHIIKVNLIDSARHERYFLAFLSSATWPLVSIFPLSPFALDLSVPQIIALKAEG